MGRSTGSFGFLSLVRAGSAAAVLAAAISCSENNTSTAPLSTSDPAFAAVKVVVVHVPDSLKRPWIYAAAPTRMFAAPSFSRDVTMASRDLGTGAVAAAASIYTVSTVDFNPEPAPSHVLIANEPDQPAIECGDCVAFNVPIGFSFTFYGKTYDQVDVSSNGLIGFGGALGTSDSPRDGCCMGWGIPGDDFYNNIIALAWTDWTPSTV